MLSRVATSLRSAAVASVVRSSSSSILPRRIPLSSSMSMRCIHSQSFSASASSSSHTAAAASTPSAPVDAHAPAAADAHHAAPATDSHHAAADGHHDAHHDAHHHDSHAAPDPRHEQAWLFGEDPTKPRVREDWEIMFYGGYALFFVGFYIVLQYGPDTSIKKWAREEALHTGFKAPDVAPDLED